MHAAEKNLPFMPLPCAGQKQHWKEHKRLCTPPALEHFLFACRVTSEADLPTIQAAVDKHNAPFDPALLKPRMLRDEDGTMIGPFGGGLQVRGWMQSGQV